MPSPQKIHIGIISGTSVDAVDCIAADFSTPAGILLGSHREPYPEQLRADILALCLDEAPSLAKLGTTDIRVGKLFARAVNTLLDKLQLNAEQVIAIGSHGQTIFHQPEGPDRFSMQIGDPNTIAELTGITTVADFRRRDMAAGGQGAPLAPLYHQAAFASPQQSTVVLNLGGIANISLLADAQSPILKGYDTGPANVLMDSWIQLHKQKPYDENGQWAVTGTVDTALLEQLLSEPYFALPPPKSTGRELFNQAWLDRHLAQHTSVSPENVQATLAALTVQTVSDSIRQSAPNCRQLIVCGGGAHNGFLMHRLADALPDAKVSGSAAMGVEPDWIEALAFAWMAEQTMRQQAIDSRGITGAAHASVFGGIYSK